MKTILAITLLTVSLAAQASTWFHVSSRWVGGTQWACTYQSNGVQLTVLMNSSCPISITR